MQSPLLPWLLGRVPQTSHSRQSPGACRWTWASPVSVRLSPPICQYTIILPLLSILLSIFVVLRSFVVNSDEGYFNQYCIFSLILFVCKVRWDIFVCFEKYNKQKNSNGKKRLPWEQNTLQWSHLQMGYFNLFTIIEINQGWIQDVCQGVLFNKRGSLLTVRFKLKKRYNS